jgi:hypothetical protein
MNKETSNEPNITIPLRLLEELTEDSTLCTYDECCPWCGHPAIAHEELLNKNTHSQYCPWVRAQSILDTIYCNSICVNTYLRCDLLPGHDGLHQAISENKTVLLEWEQEMTWTE